MMAAAGVKRLSWTKDWDSRALPALVGAFSLSAVCLLVILVYSLCVPYKPPGEQAIDKARADSQPLSPAREKRGEFREEVFRQKKLFDGPDTPSRAAKREAPPADIPLTLVGISFGERKLAVVRNEAEHKDYYLSEGDSCQGYEVSAVEKDRVILRSGVKTLELVK